MDLINNRGDPETATASCFISISCDTCDADLIRSHFQPISKL